MSRPTTYKHIREKDFVLLLNSRCSRNDPYDRMINRYGQEILSIRPIFSLAPIFPRSLNDPSRGAVYPLRSYEVCIVTSSIHFTNLSHKNGGFYAGIVPEAK